MDDSHAYSLFGPQTGFDIADVFSPRKDSKQPSNIRPSAYSAYCPSSFSLFSGAAKPSSSGWETFREEVVSTRRLEFTSPPRPIQPEVECMSPVNQASPNTQLYATSTRVIQPVTECLSPDKWAIPQTQFFTSPPKRIQPQINTAAEHLVLSPSRWSPARRFTPSSAASDVPHQQTDMTSQPMGRPATRVQRFSGPPSVCVFCKTNGERLSQYGSHVMKDQNGRVTCPILRRYTCPICGASGDTAHTIKYCPLNNTGF